MRQKYRVQWESDPVFKNWLTQGDVEDRAACACCGCELNARHSDLLRHSQTSKHLRALERFSDELPLSKNSLPKKKFKKSHGTIQQEKSSKLDLEDKDPIGGINNVDVGSFSESIGGSSSTKLDVKLLATLREIDNSNCLFLFDRCKEYNVSAHQLRYLEKEHVRDLIPKTQLGILAEFEYLLKEWKLRKGFARLETKSSKEENKGNPIMHSRGIQTNGDDIHNDYNTS